MAYYDDFYRMKLFVVKIYNFLFYATGDVAFQQSAHQLIPPKSNPKSNPKSTAHKKANSKAAETERQMYFQSLHQKRIKRFAEENRIRVLQAERRYAEMEANRIRVLRVKKDQE